MTVSAASYSRWRCTEIHCNQSLFEPHEDFYRLCFAVRHAPRFCPIDVFCAFLVWKFTYQLFATVVIIAPDLWPGFKPRRACRVVVTQVVGRPAVTDRPTDQLGGAR